MSRTELKQVVVVEKIMSGHRTNAEGAAALGPSEYVLGKHEFLRVRVSTEQVRRRVVLQSGTNGQHGAGIQHTTSKGNSHGVLYSQHNRYVDALWRVASASLESDIFSDELR